jgi:hypothetical protein
MSEDLGFTLDFPEFFSQLEEETYFFWWGLGLGAGVLAAGLDVCRKRKRIRWI